jgi:ubiquinone biosynthesis protein
MTRARPVSTGRFVGAGRLVRRAAQIAFATAVSIPAFGRELRRLRGREDAIPRAAGRVLVNLSARLGATFIKVGQIASTRGDILPRPLIEELQTLQDQVPPFPFEVVRTTIERELDRPLESLFVEFAETPVAAASVAQVHRATLRSSGTVVAVKVRRPDVLEKVRLDRTILLFVGRTLERLVPTVRLMALEGALRAFCDAVAEQIHFESEARNNDRFRANFADDPDIDFPRLHREACSDAVLTMDFVEGVHESELEAAGIDVRAIVTAGMRGVCRMIFLHGFVHADIHPGNLRFLPPGRLVLLDLGLVGELSDEDRRTTAEALFALASGDGKTVARLFHDNSPHAATPDYAAYESDMIRFVDHVRRQGLGNLQVTAEIGRIFDILRRHRIQARTHMTMVNVALMTAEGLGKRLAPELSLTDEALPYLAEALRS